jgi:DNA invertase Pin-like site-specific DNA recombinase
LTGTPWRLSGKAIIRYCKQHGYTLVRIYEDQGVSAYSDLSGSRPQFAQILDDAERGLFDVVIVHTIDRWARRSAVQIQSLERLGKAKVGFVSITENFDFSTEWGKLILTVLGAVSEFVSALIGVHVSKAQQERAESGLAVGPVPFGYLPNGPAEPPLMEPQEAEAVREVFQRRARGESNGSSAGWLNERGFQTRTGRMFTDYSVRDMLTTRFYVGVIPYQGKEYPGKHEAIIPEELYQEVQLRRQQHGRKNVKGGITGALQGMLYCGRCGNSIHSERNHLGDPRYRERHGWPCTSQGASVIARRIDGQIGTILGGVELAPEWREQILKFATTDKDGLNLEALKKQRQRIARAYGDGGYTEEEYQRRLVEIDTKMRVAVPVTLPSTEEAAALLYQVALIMPHNWWGVAGRRP